MSLCLVLLEPVVTWVSAVLLQDSQVLNQTKFGAPHSKKASAPKILKTSCMFRFLGPKFGAPRERSHLWTCGPPQGSSKKATENHTILIVIQPSVHTHSLSSENAHVKSQAFPVQMLLQKTLQRQQNQMACLLPAFLFKNLLKVCLRFVVRLCIFTLCLPPSSLSLSISLSLSLSQSLSQRVSASLPTVPSSGSTAN